MTSQLETEIERLVAPAVEAMGCAVVRVKIMGQPRRTLQVMAEHLDGSAVTVGECGNISRMISALLDVEDPVSGAYDLEVSSTGIDRPLVRRADFERFAGYEAKIEMRHTIGGRKRFRGELMGLAGDDVKIAVNGEVADLPFDDIAAAKLVLTDALIAASEQT